MKNNITCCYKCEEKKVGCHSTCERYLSQREDLDAHNRAVREYKDNQYFSKKKKK